MSRQPKPIIHGRDHAPGGADPIPGLSAGAAGPWVTPTLLNGWTTVGAPYAADLQYRTITDGLEMRGHITGGASGSVVFEVASGDELAADAHGLIPVINGSVWAIALVYFNAADRTVTAYFTMPDATATIIERYDTNDGRSTKAGFACESISPAPAGTYTLRGTWNATWAFTHNIAIACPPSGTSSPAFVAAGSNTTSGFGSITPPLPAGWAIGDLLVAEAYISNTLQSVQTPIDPSGWTRIAWETLKDTGGSPPTGAGGPYRFHGAWYRIATSGQTAPVINFTGANQLSNETFGKMTAWRNVDAPTASGTSYGLGSGINASDAPALVVPDRGLIVGLFCEYAISGTPNYVASVPGVTQHLSFDPLTVRA